MMNINIFQLLNKVWNTIRYNGLFIFLALIFPFILFKLDAGREIIRSLAEEENGLNISLCLISFFVLGFAVWCIPTWAIPLFKFMSGYQRKKDSSLESYLSDTELLTALIKIYNNDSSDGHPDKTQFPIRWFAVFPWLMFVGTYYWVNRATTIEVLLLIAFIVIPYLAFRYMFQKRAGRLPFPQNPWLFQILCTIPFLFFLSMPWLLHFTFVVNPLGYSFAIISSLGVVIFYFTLRGLENAGTNPGLSNFNYQLLLVAIVISVAVLYIINSNNQLSNISPVVILIVIASAIIAFFDLFIVSQYLLIKIVKSTPGKKLDDLNLFRINLYQIIVSVSPVLLIFFSLFSSLNTHRIRKTFDPGNYVSVSERPSFEKYFDSWFQANEKEITKDSVIYLISGQGGGSRAAAWFFMNMALKEKEDTDFFKKIFSISTVSGSSMGAYMYLGTQYFNLKTDSLSHISQKLFTKNFNSGGLFGLLIGDGINGLIHKKNNPNDDFEDDRNYHLQKEEMKAFEETFGVDPKSYFEGDYFQMYRDNPRKFPLFFINTAIVEHGTRGIFSPVPLKGVSLGRDIYQEFKNDDKNGTHNIPLTTCVNQSQSFPLLSAYNFMDGVGRFIDGGLYENTGCATTLEVYQALRKHLLSKKEKYGNIRIVMYSITNSNMAEDYTVAFHNTSILNSLTALAQSPFGGHQNFAYLNLARQAKYMNQITGFPHRDTVINISLNENITLTRGLSRHSVQEMLNSLNKVSYMDSVNSK